MTPTEQDKELRALLDEFVLYTDSSPESNEPTELKLFLEQCDFPDAIDRLYSELMQLIIADRKRVALEARIDELEHTFVSYDNALASELVENPEWEYGQVSERIAELKAQRNELFELCKQVYEATGWDGTEKFWHSLISHDMKTWSDYKLQDYKPDNLFGIRIVPLYTSDYLLEKLPKKIKRDSSTGWLVLSPMDSQGAWSVGYEPDHTEHIDDYPMEWGESPVAALLELTIKLHEEGLI